MNWDTAPQELDALRAQVAALTKDLNFAVDARLADRLDLLKQLATMTKERDELLALTAVQEMLPVPRLREQLKEEHIQHKRWQMACAAAQAHIAQLREALEIVCEGWTLPDGARKTLEKALAIPTDTAALDARLKDERKKIANHALLFLSERQREIIREMK